MVRIQATLTGLLLALVATGLVAAKSAGATAINRADLYLFNDCTGVCMPTSIQGTPPIAALQDAPGLVKLDDTGTPTQINDPNSDYHLIITPTVDPLMLPNDPISDANPRTANIRFDIGWYGTVQGAPPVPPGVGEDPPVLLFLLTALRQGFFGPTDPAIDAGYFRNSSVAIDGILEMEGVLSDCLETDPTCGPSFVMDVNSGGNPENYLGFLTELRGPTGGTPGAFLSSDLDYVSFSIDWALLEEPGPVGDFQLVNSGYVVTNVPEPALAALLVLGALALARRRA